AWNLTRDREAARDLFQETACRACANLDKFRPGTNFKAWIFTIMKNIFINDYRRKKKTQTVFDDTEDLYYLNAGKQTIRNEGDANVLIEELTHMIDELDDNLRLPFMMHYEGYKYQEIADELGLPLGTVKSRIFFARQELKRRIGARFGELPLTG
ncbi:MAG: RNA polymerase sigma factor, partial [Bacteroidetes bacterium]